MNNEPRQFTDFSSGQDGWGNDDQVWEEWAEKLGNWGELYLGEEKELEDGLDLDNGSVDNRNHPKFNDN